MMPKIVTMSATGIKITIVSASEKGSHPVRFAHTARKIEAICMLKKSAKRGEKAPITWTNAATGRSANSTIGITGTYLLIFSNVLFILKSLT